MKRLGQPLSIKKKLLLSFLILFCAPLLCFCLIWYAKSAQTIEKNVIYYNEQIIERVSTQLDEYFTSIKADSQSLPGHPLVQQFIKADPKNTYEMYILKGRISKELVPNLRKDIYSFNLISNKGAYYGELKAVPGVESDTNFKIHGISEWNGVPVITVSRKVFDNETYQPAGTIVMSLSLQQMLKIADMKPYGENGSILIVNEAGQIIYHTDRKQWGKPLPESWSRKMDSANGHFTVKSDEGAKNVLYHVSPVTGFKIISETSRSEMLGGLFQLQLLTLLIGSLILILAFLLFYRMFREIKKLLEEVHTTKMREKELELRNREALVSAMQSQINPHFLYNTLEIINSYAIMSNIMPISKMTVNLSNMFRYSISNPDQVVSLRMELTYIQHFIEIQEERFDDLVFEMDIEEEMLDKVYLFRLIIQPLVENVFKHAYEEHGLPPGRIMITGSAQTDYYSIYIRDEGRGMPEDTMNQYNQAFTKISSDRMLRVGYTPFPSIGLWNVHTRLRLAFGHPYGLEISRSGEQGTEIQLKLPYLRGVVNDVHRTDCG
ncbi:histidine kinase [Paenibacillus sp. KQZ6P-2]|uniref:Histidine kinase n=1 Tax=Paenibacillus mangrovi TaxID=2931978 RepID=A0A9X1WN75_9BACL|nr:sensor histidine kinase [Paenibacillus mangrovi]MCJ8011994.1 histidine kinase [Paenibacillus mangrovi]